MAKDRRDTLNAGEALLRQWGVAEAACGEELEPWFGRDDAADAAIVERLLSRADAASVQLLTRLSAVASKLSRKEIKRALYKLQQRGVEVPREPRKRAAAAISPEIEGVTSAFDGRGDRLVWLVKPAPAGVLHLFAVVNDPGGLREVAINRVSRKGLREIREELRAKHDIRFVDLDWRRADFVLRRALQWARDNGGSVQGDYTALRAQLTSEEPAAEVAGPLEGLELTVADGRAEASVEILAEPELRTWLLSPEAARSAVEEIGEVRTSPLVLNEAQQRERIDSILSRTINEAFADAASWARRIEEMAYYFLRTARRPRAEQAAAVARELGAGVAPVEIPFCAVYVQRTLAVMMEQVQAREQEERKASLIVTPDQVRKQR